MTVAPPHGSIEALALLAGHNLNQPPVVEDAWLIGLIRREDILKWLSLRGGREPDRDERPSQGRLNLQFMDSEKGLPSRGRISP